MLSNVEEKTCADCRCWAGRCLKGKRGMFACSPACTDFSNRTKEAEA